MADDLAEAFPKVAHGAGDGGLGVLLDLGADAGRLLGAERDAEVGGVGQRRDGDGEGKPAEDVVGARVVGGSE